MNTRAKLAAGDGSGRQGEGEGRPAGSSGLDVDPTVVGVEDLAGAVQAQPGAADVRVAAPYELFEHQVLQSGRQAGPLVGDRDSDLPASLPAPARTPPAR